VSCSSICRIVQCYWRYSPLVTCSNRTVSGTVRGFFSLEQWCTSWELQYSFLFILRRLVEKWLSTLLMLYYYYYYYYYHHHHHHNHHHHHHHHHRHYHNRISHFSASAGKHSPILGCVIDRIRLGGLIYSLKKFLIIEHVPRITYFCVCMYVFGCRLSLFRLCDSPVDDITNGITWAVFCFHIVHISFASSWFIIIIIIIIIIIWTVCLLQLSWASLNSD